MGGRLKQLYVCHLCQPLLLYCNLNHMILTQVFFDSFIVFRFFPVPLCMWCATSVGVCGLTMSGYTKNVSWVLPVL